MKAIRFALGSFLFVAFFSYVSNGQTGTFPRTFVSGTGTDSPNTCTRPSPCRTFGYTLTQTAPGGEIVALDSAGYGPAPLSIIHSVSIIAPPGVYAGIPTSSGDGIDINAGVSDSVILKGLTFQGPGNGIVFTTGGTLHVESCITNGNNIGVFFNGPGNLEAKDSIMRGGGTGIFVHPSSGTASAAIDHVRLEDNASIGLLVEDGGKVTVRNSLGSGNAFGAFVADHTTSTSSPPTELDIENCVASNNPGVGISAGSQSTVIVTVRVSNSTVTDNSNRGLNNNGSPAVLLSRGNNTVEGNGIDTVGTIGSYTAK
jgi:hypothetical protein